MQVRQELPQNLSADGEYLRIYGTSYGGRKYLNHRKKLTRGEIEYLAWLKDTRANVDMGTR